MRLRIAKIASSVLHPTLMPTYAVLLSWPLHQMWSAVGLVVLFSAAVPSAVIMTLLHTGVISDLMVSNRKERTIPYLSSILSLVAMTVSLWAVGVPPFLWHASAGMATNLAVMFAINQFWKVSAHLSGIGGLVGLIFASILSLGQHDWWLLGVLLALSVLLAWARLVRKAHTPMQLVVGFILGVLSTLVPICLF